MSEESMIPPHAAKVAYVFPGQGSQQVGMGLDLYKQFASARQVFQEADDALGFRLSSLCFEGPEPDLNLTINAQPAILTMSIACLSAAREDGLLDGQLQPSYMAGHSLGEYTALVAAGALDLADGVRLVRDRGKLMQAASRQHPGGMAAILGLELATMEDICRQTGAQIANVNCHGQIVISGSKEALAKAMKMAKAKGVRRVIPLEVSGAFHSSRMRRAIRGLVRILSALRLRSPRVPVVANTTARPLKSTRALKKELERQLCACVQWQRSVEFMSRSGVTTYVEIGPGNVLSGLIKRISKDAEVMHVGNVSSVKGLPH